MTTARRAFCLALLGSACAGVSRRGTTGEYRFPPCFEVTQLVRIVPGGDGPHELLASVRRSGDDYDVTLFDPVLAFPVLSATARGEALTEEVLAPGVRSGDGKRLLQLLREVYRPGFDVLLDGVAEASTARARYRLSGLGAPGTACRFPASIEISPRLGPGVLVRTLDVSCSGSPRAP